MKGMIVYSFAWRHLDHSPCNIRLANAAKRIIEAEPEHVVVFAQRTTAVLLKRSGIDCTEIKKQPDGYEGSEEPTRQAAAEFRAKGITEVIPIAQPFLQLIKCIQLNKQEGFKVLPFMKLARMIGWIGFDQLSVQPWTRNPISLVVYTLRQMLTGYKPPADLSE